MEMENISLKKQHIKENGFKGKNKEMEKQCLKVEVFSKELSKMISKKGLVKCTIILLEIISKDSGKMIRNKEQEP